MKYNESLTSETTFKMFKIIIEDQNCKSNIIHDSKNLKKNLIDS